MARWRRVAVLFTLLSLLTFTPTRIAECAASIARGQGAGYASTEPDVFIYVPADAAQRQPLQVLVALHGMGCTGAEFAQDLLATADRNGWLVVAPTFVYQNHLDPALILADDLANLPRLAAILDDLPARTGLQTRAQVLLYGFSRGAQTAHRFATFYPTRTLAVAVIAAGAYTLPLSTTLINGDSRPLPLPYGVADLPTYLGGPLDLPAFRHVPFRLEIGGADTDTTAVPRAWDPYLGTDRVARARAYAQALSALGVPVALGVYLGVGHTVTPAMRDDAVTFLAEAEAARRSIGAA